MDCTDCGACCVDQYIYLTEEEARAAPPDEVQGRFLRKIDGHCIRFDQLTRKCKDYENRPTVCRKFTPGCQDCVLMRLSVDRQYHWFDGTRERIRFQQGSYLRGLDNMQSVFDEDRLLIGVSMENPTPHEAEAIERTNACLPAPPR